MTQRPLRYGNFISAVRRKQRAVSYNDVTAFDARNHGRARLRLVDLHRLLTPYFRVRLSDQMRAVMPLALFLSAFLVFALKARLQDGDSIMLGILAVMGGLMFFMEGVKHGLMPFSENIGYTLPGRSNPRTVLAVAFLLGVAATFAEPAIAALKTAGTGIQAALAPVLYTLLNDKSGWLVAAVALGVGLAVALGMLRFYLSWPLKLLILVVLVPALLLTAIAGSDPKLASIVGLAWDCGAITTGPVTVPLVLATGIGVASATGKGGNPLAGFGIVTLASLFPAIAVLLLALFVARDASTATVALNLIDNLPLPWHERTPAAEIIAALRAILPLVALMWMVQRWLVREPLKQARLIAYGIVLALGGMALFNIGLSAGLVPLGTQAGGMVPGAFAQFDHLADSPLYPYPQGVVLVLTFAAALGYGATVAEPALNAMGLTVEDLTDGAFPKRLLIQTVAVGVALGTALGVAKIIFGLSMTTLILATYGLAVVLTIVSGEEYVNLAWDSAGVTTGPVTVPLVLALGLGLGQAVGATEGFGILAMASVGPIVSVLAIGLWIRYRRISRKNPGANP